MVIYPWSKLSSKSQDSDESYLLDSHSSPNNGNNGLYAEDVFKSGTFENYGSL
jgi:hypothetical protein